MPPPRKNYHIENPNFNGGSSQPEVILDPTWRNPGEGQAVSPDNFLFWDAPFFGDWEPLRYVSGTYRRIHEWQPAEGSCSVDVHVELENGTPVANAFVSLSAQEDATDATGSVTFAGVPPGRYEAFTQTQ